MTKKYAIGVENVHLELVVYNASVLSGVKCMEGKHYLVKGETIFCSTSREGVYLYLQWITLSATEAVLLRSPVRATPHGSSVTTGGNRSTQKKPATLGKVKLDNTLFTCDQGNFNQITARSRNRTLVTML